MMAPMSRPLPEFLKQIAPPALFTALPALLILTQLGPGKFLFGHDVTTIFYYTSGALGRALAEGRLPVWDPHSMCGMPLLAGMQYGALYPPSWTAGLLSPGAAWTVLVAVHLSLCGFFAHAWLTRGLGLARGGALAGATMFMLSGFAVTRIFGGHVSILFALPWTAALLWRLDRVLAAPTAARAAKLALPLLLLLLAGHPQLAQILSLAVVARLAVAAWGPREGLRERLRPIAVAAAGLAAGVLLAAPQLLPTAELAGLSHRTAAGDRDFATSYSLPPEGLLTLIAPTFFGDASTVPYWGRWALWELCGFIGVSALALAALGAAGRDPQRRLWLGVALAALLLSLGRYFPPSDFLLRFLPGAGLFRGPARHLALFTLAAAPLVAMGWNRLLGDDERLRRHATIAGAAAVGILLLCGIGWMSLDSPERWRSILAREAEAARGQRDEMHLAGPSFEEGSRRMARNSLAIAALTLAGVAAALAARRASRPAWSAAGFAVLLGAELIGFNLRFLTDHAVEGMELPPRFVEQVRSHPSAPFRIATVSPAHMDVVGKCRLAGLDHVGGYEPMMLDRYLELSRAAGSLGDRTSGVAATPSRPGPVTDLLGARYWIVPGPRQVPPGWSEAGPLLDGFVYENPRALPRAFLVGRSVVLPSKEERLAYLAAPAFDPSRVVVLETGSAGGTEGAAGRVAIRSRGPGFYELEARAERDAWLVLSETDYPGWRATVGGAPAEILRANHLVQALRLPPGDHVVRFEMRSGSLRLGFWIAGATALAGLGILLLSARRSA